MLELAETNGHRDPLNQRGLACAARMTAAAERLRIAVSEIPGGGRLLDCGIAAPGGLAAGLELARACLADLAEVSVVPGELAGQSVPMVTVATDHPISACMASQYAGWQIALGRFFAMGSGPMRAAYGREELFSRPALTALRERATAVLGVLETRKAPGAEVFAYIGDKLGLPASAVTLLAAPTASVAGGLQVVARSVETALHKLTELGFDLGSVVSGWGCAPLPPPARDDLTALGRTNDAILYAGRVCLWVRASDDQLAELGPRVPSSASAAHGRPFVELFEAADRDFYKMDSALFSPAEVVLFNIETGRTHRFGRLEPTIAARSLFV